MTPPTHTRFMMSLNTVPLLHKLPIRGGDPYLAHARQCGTEPQDRQDQNQGTLQSDLTGEGEVVGKAFPAAWVHRERKLDQEVS